MKARLLRKLLNNTDYNISNHREYIAVGSNLCHDLISVNKETLKVKYALDTFREGKAAIKHKPLVEIWDKLHELIETGQIHDIINGKDEIENPLPVFTVESGKLIESVTDAYGWPNTDDDGICMYENTHFPTAQQAIEYGIKEYQAAVNICARTIDNIKQDLLKAEQRLEKYKGYIANLEAMQKAAVSSWVAFDWNKIETRPTEYGKYLICRKDGKIHWETWNGSGWAYNHNEIRFWAVIVPPCR